METAKIILSGIEFTAPTGASDARTAIYYHDEAASLEAISPLMKNRAAIVCLSGCDWDRDLSPWPAKRAFRGGNDFAGGADAYLDRLVPAIAAYEAQTGLNPVRRVIAGYSLAGLFALYAVCRSDFFTAAGSMSGSLWYDGFCDYFASRPPRHIRKVYLSLGDRESAAKNPRLASVGACTQRIYQLLTAEGIEARFDVNPGGHFVDTSPRMALGFDYLSV